MFCQLRAGSPGVSWSWDLIKVPNLCAAPFPHLWDRSCGGGCSCSQQLGARSKAHSPLRPARTAGCGLEQHDWICEPVPRSPLALGPPRVLPIPGPPSQVAWALASPQAGRARCRPRRRRLRLLIHRLTRRGDANEPTVSAAPSRAGASRCLALVRRRWLPPPRPSRAGVDSSHLGSLAQARCSLLRAHST